MLLSHPHGPPPQSLLHHLPPIHSDFHQMNASPHAAGFMDFGFLDSGRKIRNNWSFGSEIEFQPQTCVEDGVGICSPPLWQKTESIQNEISPLLRHDHCFSHPSRASQLEKIADARRELMEMVTNMSESTYELSLKDIVDDEQHTSQEVPEEGSVEERSMSFNSEVQLLQQKKSNTKRKNINSRQIMRSASMEKEAFQLKMFFPTSLGLRRKSAAGHGSKVSQKSLCDNPEDNVDKEGWRRFLCAGQSKNNGIHSIRSSSRSSDSCSRSNSSKRRQASGVHLLGCWSIFQPKKATPEDREDYSDDKKTI